jgi:bisphosphoglycerate-dependent phosphoglycerate mutase
MELDLLQRMFGGRVHKHLYIYLWTVSKKENLLDIAEQVLPYWKTEANPRLKVLMDWAAPTA